MPDKMMVELVEATVHLIPEGPFIVEVSGGPMGGEQAEAFVNEIKRITGRKDFVLVTLPEGSSLLIYQETSDA